MKKVGFISLFLFILFLGWCSNTSNLQPNENINNKNKQIEKLDSKESVKEKTEKITNSNANDNLDGKRIDKNVVRTGKEKSIKDEKKYLWEDKLKLKKEQEKKYEEQIKKIKEEIEKWEKEQQKNLKNLNLSYCETKYKSKQFQDDCKLKMIFSKYNKKGCLLVKNDEKLFKKCNEIKQWIEKYKKIKQWERYYNTYYNKN